MSTGRKTRDRLELQLLIAEQVGGRVLVRQNPGGFVPVGLRVESRQVVIQEVFA